MYEKLKRTVKWFLPQKFIKNNESFFRSIVALKYRGDNFQCNICEAKLSRFILLKNGQKLCPKCGSLPRTRRLWAVLTEDSTFKTSDVLHFSPPKSLMNAITKYGVKKYVPTDYAGEFDALKQIDIEAIDEPSNSFDVIICFHVLEHILNDSKAIEELYRVLKSGGKCLIQTPFKSGDTYENPLIVDEEDRLLHFGQKDHVRIYSVEGLVKRLKNVGFTITVNDFKCEAENVHGYNSEIVLFATK